MAVYQHDVLRVGAAHTHRLATQAARLSGVADTLC
jgi:hypothetical protein